jgi:DNA-binding GntR family transcriptional regulator
MTGTPIQFATKAGAVHEELRHRILSGVLGPSAPVNQDALALELGVSVTPVREAVRRLEAEGLLKFEAHKTVIVSPLSRTEVDEIYDVRLQLDPYAAALATSLATEADLLEVDRLAKGKANSDPIAQVALNRAFHRSVYALSRNALLTEILDRLWERTDRYRIMLLTREVDVVTVAREHAEIAAAMRTRRPQTVAKLIRAHVAKARALIEDTLD